MCNAEALFLVDDDKTEIVEFDIGGEQSVRTDDDIDFTSSDGADGRVLLARRFEAGEIGYLDRESAHTGADGVVVLHGKDRRGHEDCHLLAVHDRLERGAESDLRFTEAYVTAEQSIHRDGALHIVLDILDCKKLSVRLLVIEGRFEFPLHLVVGRERVAGTAHTLGVERDEFFRHRLDRRFDLRLCLAPFGTAETGKLQRSVLCRRADVFGNGVDLLAGDVEHVLARILDLDVVASDALVIADALQALVDTDAVDVVNDIIPDVQVRVGKDLFLGGGSRLSCALSASNGALGLVAAARE